MAVVLTPNQRAYLKGLANRLKATVWIGKQGLAEPVLEAIDKAFESAELLKLKLLESVPEERRAAARTIEENVDCAVVQVVGRVIVLYRPFRERPEIQLPPPRRKEGA